MRALVAIALLCVAGLANASAWTQHAVGTLQTSDNAAPTMPTFTVGDVGVMYSMAQTSGVARSLSTPAGWTRVFTDETSTLIDIDVYCRVLQMGDTGPTLDWTASDSNVRSQIISYSGPTAPDCSSIVHASGGSVGTSGAWPSAAITISQANTLVLSFSIKINQAGSGYGTVTCPSDINDASNGVTRDVAAISFYPQLMICQRIETTATSTSGGNHGVSGTQGSTTVGRWAVSLLEQDITAPTYSVSPAIGTRTTSSIPITQTTTCSDCTAYFVAETDGLGTPTCTQIKAGKGADGNAAYKSASGAITASVQLTLTLSSYTDGTVRDGYGCLHSTANGDSSVSAIADMYKIPVSSCTYNSATSGSVTYDCTLDGAGTIYGVACIKDSTDATQTQVEAAHCTGDVAAKASANRSGTGSLTVGSTLPNPVYDFSFAGTYGSQHEAATHQDFDRCLAAASGKQIINCPNGLTSIGVGSAVETLNAAITPDWAVGDIPVCDTYTHSTPGGTQQFLFHLSVSGYASYDSGDGSRTYANCDAYDVSVGAMATVANASNDLDWWDQDPAIACQPPFSLVLKTNVAMNVSPNPGNVDFTTKCVHPLGDTITTALTSGTWPTGLTLSANVLSGTPTVEIEGGTAEAVTPTSTVTGASSAPQALTAYVWTTLTSTNCTSTLTTLAACESAYNQQFLGKVSFTESFHCSTTVPPGYVISTSPTGGAEVAPYTTVSIVYSDTTCSETFKTISCLRKSVTQCEAAVTAAYGILIGVLATQNCSIPAYSGGLIFEQAPAAGRTINSPANIVVDYCP